MFYDLEAPLDFVRDVAEVLDEDGIWVFEQSYLPSMLDTTSYDTVCHEHLEYYAVKQIQWLCARAGFKILDVAFSDTNGGSFSVVAAKIGAVHQENISLVEEIVARETALGVDSLPLYREFAARVEKHRDELNARLDEIHRKGQLILGYGASTKGNVMLQFCNISSQQIPYIAEVNPDKFGSFTPQTLIPIISEEQAHAMHPDVFLVLPWHFRSTIIGREKNFLQAGGKLLFPLPVIEISGNANSSDHRV
jgi:hypothetical protein